MATIRDFTSWRPRTPFYYGWLVLAVAAVGTFGATGITQVVLGGIQNLIFEDMGWDRSTIAFAVTAGTLTSGVLTPVFGRLADQYGPRGLMPAASVVVGLCFFGLAGTQAVWHFYVAYIIGRAVANPALVSLVPRTAAVNFFRRRRNLAIGIASMARPVGGSINVQIISLIARGYGWRVAYRVLAVFALIMAVPLFLVMRRRPEDIGLLPDGESRQVAPRDANPRAGDRTADGPGFRWTAGAAAVTSTFWLIVMADSLTILTEGAVNFQIVPYLTDSGLSFAAAAGGFSLSVLLGALMNPGWGYLADKYPPRRLALYLLPVTAGITTLFLVSDSGAMGFAVVVIWGAASGGLNVLSTMMLARYFGRSSFGSIAGLTGPFQMGALGLGPTLGAVLFRATGGYTALFLYSLGSYLLAIAFLYAVSTPKRPDRAISDSTAGRSSRKVDGKGS